MAAAENEDGLETVMAAKYRKIDPRIWDDETGQSHAVSFCKQWMPQKNGLQAKVRCFVYLRDDFTCVKCQKKAISIPDNYNGRFTIPPSELDHKLPRSKGGGHHPNNLQTLCQSCNARKCDRED
ncbi:MAG: HNH endonuclease [Planctomycetota bacterium]